MNAVTSKNTAYTRAPIKSAALKLGALTICLTAASQVASQEQPDSNANSKNRTIQTPSLETVVVTAPATKDERVSIESKTPVDTLTHEAIDSVASSDLNDKLTRLVPSYQVQRNTISNGNIFTRTATLRNLSPDHTLILVDGKRRHRSAYVDVTQLGAQAVDVSQIPSIALKKIEVLRDGSATRYGAEAIAGTINLITDDTPGFRAFTQAGQYYAGDGENLQAGFNLGIPLSERGSLNISVEGNNNDRTSRVNQNAAALALARNGGVHGSAVDYQQSIKDPVQRFGQPEQENYRSLLNFKLDVSESLSLYAVGTYSKSSGSADFLWRNPDSNNYFNPTPDWGSYSLRSIYPGGFTPIFSMKGEDSDIVAGMTGLLTEKLSWDFSVHQGKNSIDYYMKDTINASLGPASPTSFYTGSRELVEHGANLDFTYDLYDFVVPTTVLFGTEYREEESSAHQGDAASYALGPGASYGYPGGSNGFFGTDPTQVGSWKQRGLAAYFNVDSKVTNQWQIGAGTRYEHYDQDAGFGTIGSLSSRYEIVPGIAVRGSIGTAFKVPTPGQSNLTNTSQRPSEDSSSIVTTGTIPSTNPVAVVRGGKALKPERSKNISAGMTFELSPSSSLAIDYYRIEVRDRLGLSPNQQLTTAERADLVASGVTLAQGLDTFNYYVNGFTTNTQGVDVVYSKAFALQNDIAIDLTALYNYNRTHVTDSETGVVSDLTRQSLQDRLPRHKASLTFDIQKGKYAAMLRSTYYSAWTQPFWNDVSINQRFGPEVFVDANISYQISPEAKVTLGADNLFDNYPDKDKRLASLGAKYPMYRPYDADGGSYYLRLDYKY